MIEYIKVFLISLISAFTSPLPTSSSAHFSALNVITGYSADEKTLAFMSGIITLVFSVSVFFTLRKIYAKGIRSLFVKKEEREGVKSYRSFMGRLLFTLIPVAVMFIPVGKGRFVLDVFSSLLTDVAPEVLIRETLSYIAPPYFIISTARIVRTVLLGVAVDPIAVVIAVVASAAASLLSLNLLGKLNFRRLFLFFSIYTVVFGIFMGALTFIF